MARLISIWELAELSVFTNLAQSFKRLPSIDSQCLTLERSTDELIKYINYPKIQ